MLLLIKHHEMLDFLSMEAYFEFKEEMDNVIKCKPIIY